MTNPGRIVVVVGNPSPGSRTLAAAVELAGRVARRLGVDGLPVELDLAAMGHALLSWGAEPVTDAVRTVIAADALVVASPTYKASFTGLTKLFLDQFDRDALGGIPTVPMMTGGSLAHCLAVEVHLRPVLVEIGASCPTRGVYLSGGAVDHPGPTLDAWEAVAGPTLERLRGS